MVELLESGVNNIACLQPFACTKSHSRKRDDKRTTTIISLCEYCSIDYDASASEVNQINRLKLMLSIANKHLRRK